MSSLFSQLFSECFGGQPHHHSQLHLHPSVYAPTLASRYVVVSVFVPASLALFNDHYLFWDVYLFLRSFELPCQPVLIKRRVNNTPTLSQLVLNLCKLRSISDEQISEDHLSKYLKNLNMTKIWK